jgi:hypothetical protein
MAEQTSISNVITLELYRLLYLHSSFHWPAEQDERKVRVLALEVVQVKEQEHELRD